MAPIDTCDKHVYPATLIYRTNILLPAPQKTYKSMSTLDLACHCNNVAQVSPCTTLHNIYECVLIFWYVVWSCVVLSSLRKMKYYFIMFSVLSFRCVCWFARSGRIFGLTSADRKQACQQDITESVVAIRNPTENFHYGKVILTYSTILPSKELHYSQHCTRETWSSFRHLRHWIDPNRASLFVWLLAYFRYFNNQRLGNCEAG